MTGKKIMAGEDVSLERQLHYDWEFHFALVRACNSRHMIACLPKYLRKIHWLPTGAAQLSLGKSP
jgi:DNA-binding GntR family transcriptional regulator